MAQYSILLKHVLQFIDLDTELSSLNWFSDEFRDKLITKLKNTYMFREIGFETPERFLHELKSELENILPYFNQLLQSELLSVNPLLSFSKTSTSEKDNDVSQSLSNTTGVNSTVVNDQDDVRNSTTSTDETRNESNISNDVVDNESVFYDTPMGSLGDIKNTDRATNVTKEGTTSNSNNNNESIVDSDTTNTDIFSSDVTTTTGTDSTSSTTNNTSTDETITVSEEGTNLSHSELLLKYRETFLNVEKQILDNLNDLFMLIY